MRYCRFFRASNMPKNDTEDGPRLDRKRTEVIPSHNRGKIKAKKRSKQTAEDEPTMSRR